MAPDTYNHLDATDPPTLTMSMPQLVAMVDRMNYGVHRFLSELLRQRRTLQYPGKETDMLAKLLQGGFF